MLKLLTADEKQFYNDNGYVHLSNVFSPDEVEEMSEEYDTIFERMSRDTKSRERGFNVVQSGASGCEKGFVKCFLRVPHAVALYFSCRAAQESKGNFQKTVYKTFFTA